MLKYVAIKVGNCVAVELGSDETALRIARGTPSVKQHGTPAWIDTGCKIQSSRKRCRWQSGDQHGDIARYECNRCVVEPRSSVQATIDNRQACKQTAVEKTEEV